jgi:NAD(P)-dependent dehydrogenase (short-subunit alcohol dehydrogenase family)
VFITDADSDCGQALMAHLAGEGATLLLASASGGQAIRSQLARCEAAGTRAVVVNVDLCRSAEVEALLEASARELGPVDMLVHNNNVVRPISVETGEEEAFLDIMNANAKSAFVCTKAVGKTMAARQAGRIIFVGSIHAEKPTGSSFAYSASKGAVKMLAREAAIVLGRQGVSVNSIELGPVEGDDERFQSSISTLYDSYQYKVPRAELGTYDDLAGLVLYLASEEARHVNGADIRLDGGFLMHYMDFKMKKPQSAEGGVTP